jgi:hypothetical protein
MADAWFVTPRGEEMRHDADAVEVVGDDDGSRLSTIRVHGHGVFLVRGGSRELRDLLARGGISRAEMRLLSRRPGFDTAPGPS